MKRIALHGYKLFQLHDIVADFPEISDRDGTNHTISVERQRQKQGQSNKFLLWNIVDKMKNQKLTCLNDCLYLFL